VQHAAQRDDLPPVRVLDRPGLVVQRGDCGLQRVRAGVPAGQRLLDQDDAFVDLGCVPAGPILVGERHEIARLVGASSSAGVDQQQ
jgi:hypothetical protein